MNYFNSVPVTQRVTTSKVQLLKYIFKQPVYKASVILFQKFCRFLEISEIV